MDLLVDDSPGHIKNVQKHNLKGILFGDYSWNSSFEHRDGIDLTATDWLDVEQHVEQLSQ